MGAFRITGNLLMSFALYWGVIALLYGGTDVSKGIAGQGVYREPGPGTAGQTSRYVPSDDVFASGEHKVGVGGGI